MLRENKLATAVFVPLQLGISCLPQIKKLGKCDVRLLITPASWSSSSNSMELGFRHRTFMCLTIQLSIPAYRTQIAKYVLGTSWQVQVYFNLDWSNPSFRHYLYMFQLLLQDKTHVRSSYKWMHIQLRLKQADRPNQLSLIFHGQLNSVARATNISEQNSFQHYILTAS